MTVAVQDKFQVLVGGMNDRLQRHWTACEAMRQGRDGISAVSRATSISQTTIRKGIAEIQEQMPHLTEEIGQGRSRRTGGGRPLLTATDKSLGRDLKRMSEPATHGKPTHVFL